MRILLITPPMTQINAPYAATPHLAGFLRERGYDARQADAGLDLALRLFSRQGVAAMRRELSCHGPRGASPAVRGFLARAQRYATTVDSVVRYLQGRDPTLAYRIVTREFLPEGPRFAALAAAAGDPLHRAFGALGLHDQARHLASLFLDDLTDVVREGLDPRFDLARFAEGLAVRAPRFDPILRALRGPPTLLDRLVDAIAGELLDRHAPDLVGFTVPFPGTVYGAFRMAARMKARDAAVRTVLGGGYVSTELRSLSDPRVFDYADFLILDDGEAPLLRLLEHLRRPRARPCLLRTLVREGRRVVLRTAAGTADVPHERAGTPVHDGLSLDRYVSMLEMLNPMMRLWSDGRWNRLRLAHGCYWHRCRFCDTARDSIARYDPARPETLVARIEAVVRETGQAGFHFVDEAAPPALLERLAARLLARRRPITWWVNIRFERAFTPALARRLARAGCVAVTGGVEAPTNRLLRLMRKGFSLGQVARVTHALAEAGIMVHTYLMYGLPSETVQETVDGLEFVRQLFAAGCIQSAFWHRFALTVHSPIGCNPAAFGIRLVSRPRASFAENDIPYADPVRADHARLGRGLRKAVYNYMCGHGLDADVREWFDRPVPPPILPNDFVCRQLVRRLASGAATVATRGRGEQDPAGDGSTLRGSGSRPGTGGPPPGQLASCRRHGRAANA